MCGIAGIVTSSGFSNEADRVRDMVRALARRGPDGEGVERFSSAVLGHRRLSIFDLSDAGDSPWPRPIAR